VTLAVFDLVPSQLLPELVSVTDTSWSGKILNAQIASALKKSSFAFGSPVT
jgi:hypothetical protein